jgi:Cytochrome b5-like Heme/Steroid binding domain
VVVPTGDLFFLILGVVTIRGTCEIVYYIYRPRRLVPGTTIKRTLLSHDSAELLAMVRRGCTPGEIMEAFPYTIWVIFNNKVYDVTNFAHPGGAYIFEHVKGRDVSRFLYGGYGLELDNGPAWEHSRFALERLDKYYLGSVPFGDCLMFGKQGGEAWTQQLPGNVNSEVMQGSGEVHIMEGVKSWALVEKVDLTPCVVLFIFKSPDKVFYQQKTGLNFLFECVFHFHKVISA